jgi:predicted DNA-binding transcriptional regulator AlpA
MDTKKDGFEEPPARKDEKAESLTVTTEGAAKMLGISLAHFHNMRKAGKLGPKPSRLGRRCLYIKAEMWEWLNAGCPARDRWLIMRGKSR